MQDIYVCRKRERESRNLSNSWPPKAQTVQCTALVMPWKPSTGRQEQISWVLWWDCFFFFLWTYLLSISEQNRPVLMLTYKYVAVGRGGRGANIVSGSKHACWIICNIPIFILPISLLLTKSQKYPISFAATRQTLSHPRNSYASLSIPVGITGPFYDWNDSFGS